MSNQPPSDPLQPDPTSPFGPPPDDRQVSGQPWSAPSGDPLSEAPPPSPAGPPSDVPPPGPRPPQPGQPSVPYPTTPLPPAGPSFRPGYASLPPQPPENPPTAAFPPPEYGSPQYGSPDYGSPDYGSPEYSPPEYSPPEYSAADYSAPGYGPPPGSVPPGYGTPGYGAPGYGPPPPRKSNVPLIAVIVAVTLLLCGGAVTAGVLVVRNVTDRAKEAIEPIVDPTPPALPTDLPTMPTNLPELPTDLPGLPTNLPQLPDTGKKITVVYEVTGDGPAEIVYTEKLGDGPKRVSNVKLPWKITTTMQGAALVSVVAVRSATDNGEISCRATVDGEEVAQRTREGSFATASCTKMILN